MTEVLIPPDIIPQEESVELVDDGTVPFAPQFGNALTQRQQYFEPYLKVTQIWRDLRGADLARMQSIVRTLQGSFNTLRAVVGNTLRGSFPATELLANNDFSNGTTGWTADSNACTMTVADNVARITAKGNINYPEIYQSLASTQYAPHVIRSFVTEGRGGVGVNMGQFLGAGNNGLDNYSTTARGLISLSAVTDSAASEAQFPIVAVPAAGYVSAGDYFDLSWCSLSRCALVDNGPNLLTYSDQFDNGWSAADTTADPDSTTAPDGTATADGIDETATTAPHYTAQAVTVSSSAADYAFACALKSNGRQWGYLRLYEPSGATQAYQTFDLTNGVLGTASAIVGAGWSNLRAFIRDIGNGWFYCCIVARKINAGTSVQAWVGPSDGDNANSYLGIAGTGIRAWRATLAQSSVPTRLVQTTSAATSGTAQTGNALYLKGGPASTSGALLSGDLIQVGDELKQLTGSVDFDAAGLGYAQFDPALVTSPDDSDPVIINKPTGKFILADAPKWTNRFGVYADLTLTFREIYEP